MAERPDRIPDRDYKRVKQRAPHELTPHMRQRIGPEGVAMELRRRAFLAMLARSKVMGERAEAEARGVAVVVDETRPDQYYWSAPYAGG
jgi:hypothetical protein